jgi:hypothetical protein
MNTKLTLTMEQDVIEKAKEYARKKEQSLSDLVENYFKALVENKSSTKDELTPMVKAIKGSFKAPKHFDYKKELMLSLEEKYL